MPYTPLVSYAIPCYNVGSYLPEALESIEKDMVMSNIHPQEANLILLNDGSTDNTGRVIESYCNDASMPVQTMYSPMASGEGGARAKLLEALHLSGAQFYRFIDGDDTLVPGSTEHMIDRAWDTSAIAVSGSHTTFGNRESYTATFPLDDSEIRNTYRQHNPFPTAYALLSGELTREHNISVSKKWKVTADYALCIELMKYGKLSSLPESVANYRKHPNSITGQEIKKVHASFMRICLENWRIEGLPQPVLKDYAALAKVALLFAIPKILHPLLVSAKRALL